MMKKLLVLLTMLPLAALADLVDPPYDVFPKPVTSLELAFCCVLVGLFLIGCLIADLVRIKAGKRGRVFRGYNVIVVTGLIVALCGLCLAWHKVVCCSCKGSGCVRYSGHFGVWEYNGEKFECECCKGKGFHWTWNYTCVENPTRTIYPKRPHRCQHCHSSSCYGQCQDLNAATTATKFRKSELDAAHDCSGE